MILRELVTKLGFKTDTTGVKKADGIFNGLYKRAKSLTGTYSLVATGVTAAYTATVGALFGLVKSAADVGDNAYKTSQKIGVGVEQFQRLSYAAKLADLSQEGLTTGLKFLSKNLVDATEGGKETSEAFKELGLDPKKYLGNTEDLLIAISDQFQKMPDGAKKSALSMKVFGKSGVEMIPFLNSGGKAIRELGLEAEMFGLIVREDAAKQSEAFNDNLTRLSSIIIGLKNTVGQQLLPVFASAVQGMVEWYKANHQVIKSKVTEWFSKLIALTQRIAPILRKIGENFSTMFKKLYGEGKGSIDFFDLVGDLLVIILGLVQKTQDAMIAFSNTEFGSAVVNSIKELIKWFTLLVDDVAAYFEGRESLTGYLVDALKTVMREWTDLFSAFFDYLKAGFEDVGNTIANLASRNHFKEVARIINGESFSKFNEARGRLSEKLLDRANKAQQYGPLTIIPGLEAFARGVSAAKQGPLGNQSASDYGSIFNRKASSIAPASARAGVGPMTNNSNKTVNQTNNVRIEVSENNFEAKVWSVIQKLLRGAQEDLSVQGA